jgi:hypothetical protein
MPPFKDRLSDEAITPVIASFKSLWFDEHQRRHDRHLVPITAQPVEKTRETPGRSRLLLRGTASQLTTAVSRWGGSGTAMRLPHGA